MRYEYKPSLLQGWLREKRQPLLEKKIENSNEKYRGLLEQLKEEFQSKSFLSETAFIRWANKLSRREKLLLPNLYDEKLPEDIKKQ